MNEHRMLRRFLDGLVFGGGFAIAFVAIWHVAAYLVLPAVFNARIEQIAGDRIAGFGDDLRQSLARDSDAAAVPFHELKLADQIRLSSVIALAKYEPAPDGRMKAIIREFLKKDAGVTLYYGVGDEYPSAGFSPRQDTSYGDGVVIFFTGSPAMMRLSMSYAGDRIRGLGDLPLELFRDKCREPGT